MNAPTSTGCGGDVLALSLDVSAVPARPVGAGRYTIDLATALAASGATLADVLKTSVFVASTERADLVAVWDVVSAAFGDHDAPSTLLGVTALGWPDQLVEIEAVAVAAG